MIPAAPRKPPRELTTATFPAGEDDPNYHALLEEARFAPVKTGSPYRDLQSRWLADLRKAQRDGAKKLADGREFTLKCGDEMHHLIKNGRESFKGIASDDAGILIAVSDESKLVPQFTRIAFDQMCIDSRMDLSCLSTDDKAAQAALRVKWAVMRATVFNSMTMAEAIGALGKAEEADGVPDALLNDAKEDGCWPATRTGGLPPIRLRRVRIRQGDVLPIPLRR